MASSLNSKRVFLMMLSAFGLVAALICIIALVAGVREPTRERVFLAGSLLVVSAVCLALSFHFKDAAQTLGAAAEAAHVAPADPDARDTDDAPLPQNAPADPAPDPDDVALPQNDPAGRA